MWRTGFLGMGATIVLGCGLTAAASGSAGSVATCASGEVKLSLGPLVSPMTGEHADLFELTNRSRMPCALDGYPGVRLSHRSKPLAFVYARGGGPYVTKRKPERVTLPPGHRAYVLVAQYRCDGGVLYPVTTIRMSLPSRTGYLTLNLSGQGVSGLNYCKRYPGDQPVDPGNRVTVSPVEASLQATRPGS